MPHHYIAPNINTLDAETQPGNCIYEIHYLFKPDRHTHGGYSIRFIEAEDTPTGCDAAAVDVLEDTLRFFSDTAVAEMEIPHMTLCRRHISWEALKKSRQIRTPATTARSPGGRVMRAEKRHPKIEDMLDILEDLIGGHNGG